MINVTDGTIVAVYVVGPHPTQEETGPAPHGVCCLPDLRVVLVDMTRTHHRTGTGQRVAAEIVRATGQTYGTSGAQMKSA